MYIIANKRKKSQYCALEKLRERENLFFRYSKTVIHIWMKEN